MSLFGEGGWDQWLIDNKIPQQPSGPTPPPTPPPSVLPEGTFNAEGQLSRGAAPQQVTPIEQLVGGTKKFDPHQLSTALRQTTPATPTGAVTAPVTGDE